MGIAYHALRAACHSRRIHYGQPTFQEPGRLPATGLTLSAPYNRSCWSPMPTVAAKCLLSVGRNLTYWNTMRRGPSC